MYIKKLHLKTEDITSNVYQIMLLIAVVKGKTWQEMTIKFDRFFRIIILVFR